MTLKKTKSRQPAPPRRKRTAQHHRQSRRYQSTYWPYLPIVVIILSGLLFNNWYAHIQRSVLGYATDMSISSLASNTNAQRAANGFGSLALNSLLNQAAQAKANDMVARNYWSHNTPDGQTPWTFIVATGYSYQTAGENLAYGFSTASDTIAGWMNSPGHRANILNGSFQEVGFGMANSPDYQGNGPETVVVAVYAQPVSVAATQSEPTPAAPVPSVAVAPQPPAKTSPVTTPVPQSTDTAPISGAAEESSAGGTAQTPIAELPKNATKQGDPPLAAQQADTVAPRKITRVQTITATNVAWSQFAVSMLATVALLAFLLRHSFAWHKVLRRGESFILHHPLLDIVFIAIATLGFILLQTSGNIR